MTSDRRLVPSPSSSSSSSTSAVGLCLLPSELLLEIFFQLALPELLRLRSVSRLLDSLVSGDDFRRLYDLRSGRGGGWLFVYKKRPPRYSVLRGFNDRTGRWFQISLAGILAPAVPPTEDLYFLAASGGFFLFASNARRELVAVNLATRAVRRLPPSPLGPRGTSSWRRSGLKLVADPSGADRFRFLFADMFQNRPALFEYDSETDGWRVIEAQETAASQPPAPVDEGRVCLSVTHFGAESLVLSCAGAGGDSSETAPTAHRPRFPQGLDGGPLVGFATSDRFHVYGDGYVAVIRSTAAAEEGGGGRGASRTRAIASVELLGMNGEGSGWELVSRAPEAVVTAVRRPYGVMMGCLVEREGTVRIVLMSNCRGTWDLAWLAYHHRSVGGTQQGTWTWVPVPDCGTKGLNMAGLAISSTFSRLWHASARYKSSQ